MNEIATAVALAIINSKLLDALKAPVERQYPNLNLWWMLYVSFITGALLAWFAQVNIMAGFIPDPVVGRLITGLFVGGGASLIYDVFTDSGPELVVEMDEMEAASVTAEAQSAPDALR